MGQKTDRFLLAYADFIIRFRWLVVLASLFVVGAAAYGAKNLEFSSNYRIYFGAENPELKDYEAFQKVYAKHMSLIFIVKPPGGNVFTPTVIDAVEKITQAAWKLPYARRVDSITNFQHSSADGDGLAVNELIRGGKSMTERELQDKKKIVMGEPLLYGRLLARGAGATGVYVTLHYPEKSLQEAIEVAAAGRKVVAQIQAEYPGLRVVLSGDTMFDSAFAEVGEKDARTHTPIMYLVLVAVMAFTLRSFSATFATLLMIVFSCAIAMGLAGHFGVLLSPVAINAPTIIMTLAVADSIHMLIAMIGLMRDGQDKNSALKDSVRTNFVPIMITSVTTLFGFLTLNFADSPPFHDLGNITALGIAAAWIYSMTFLPAVLSLLPLKVKPSAAGAAGQRYFAALLARYAAFVVEKRKPILAVTILCVAGLAALVPRIELNDDWVEYFDRSVPFRQDMEFGLRELTGIYPLEFSVPSAGPGGINQPEYLRALDRFAAWLEAQPGVRHVASHAAILKRLNSNMHGDDPAWYRVPDSRELAAQYFLTYQMSLPFGLDLNDRISIDSSATRVSALLDAIPMVEQRALFASAEKWLEDNAPAYMRTRATGAPVMFSHMSERNIQSMITGDLLGLFVIAAVISLFLRSLGIGLLTIIPNAVPTVMTFGLWAVTVERVGIAAAVASSIALGIIVDDTVHFMAKYLRARREKGLDRPEAIAYAFGTVGVALIVTSVILISGFLVLTTSSFLVSQQTGVLTAITMVFGIVMDFTLLPALLLTGHKKDAGRAAA